MFQSLHPKLNFSEARLTRARLNFEPRLAREHVTVLHWISNLYQFSNQAVHLGQA